MNARQLLVAGGLSLSAILVPACSDRLARDSTRNQLIALEREMSTAFLDKNEARLSAMLGNDYIVTYGDGSVGDKKAELGVLADTTETITASALDAFTIHDYGTFAVVNFRVTASGVRKGKPLHAQFRYTDVFVRRGGRWECIASQNTAIGEPKL